MWIETVTKQNAMDIQAFFNHKQFTLNNKTYNIAASAGGVITVDGISKSGIMSQKDAEEMTRVGHEFYRLLKEAPTFSYALTGVEVEHWRTLDELKSDPSDLLGINGLVIQEDMYARLGAPENLPPFRPGYVWNPYLGEVWQNGNKTRYES